MTTSRSVANRDYDNILDEMGVPRSLADVLETVDLSNLTRRPVQTEAHLRNLLVTSAGLGRTQTAVPHPGLANAPLLAAVTGVDDSDPAVRPIEVAFTNNAAATAEGDALPESDLSYTVGATQALATVGHTIPISKQALGHNATLRADVDTFLSGGLIVKLEKLIADQLAVGVGIGTQAFDTDIATTVRTGIASAQTAMRELGPGVITVAMSPGDHARLDLANYDLAQWPATIVSSPALPDGFAYIGRLKLGIQLFTTRVLVTFGYVSNQFVQNQVTARATVEALAHLAAPAVIIKTDVTA